MSGEAAATLVAVNAVQLLLSTFDNTLNIGSFECPVDSTIETIFSTSFDYIIVGAGSAGSVLANRLSACTNKNILLIEAGGCPPIESILPGYFTLQPLSSFDYNYTSHNDLYAGQNLQDGSVGITIGKMLGGSTGIHHTLWVRGVPRDYNAWTTATKDKTWCYNNLLPYFKKSENVLDKYIRKEYSHYTGDRGATLLKRQHSSENDGIFEALNELGYTKVNNSNAKARNYIALEPLLTIGFDGRRQSGLTSYIKPVIGRSNLFVLTNATVSKVNFNENKVATGVTFIHNDNSYTVNANSEVIICTGGIITPQLLMLSGIGPSEHLKKFNISTISNLSLVGQNLMDHTAANMIFSLKTDISTSPGGDPFAFPVPLTCNYVNLDNKTADWHEFQSINLVFPQDSTGFMQLCTNSFKYTNGICDAMYKSNSGKKTLWIVPNILYPLSRGSVTLNTTSIFDQPIVKLGLLSEKDDLAKLAKFLNHMAQLVNTTYFKSIGGQFNDLGLCRNETLYSTEFWQCYALAMSSTMWHYSGTAAMGSVVDTNGLVYGVQNLRVVDASILPSLLGGNINAGVVVAAEKIADVIVNGLDTCTKG